MTPNAIVITAAGINCEGELAEAFALAGARPQFVHLNALKRHPAQLDRYHLIGLPGGFSYGDAIAAGRIMAQLMRRYLYQPLVEAVQRGVPIIAPCNGFQIAVQMGLLPGPALDESWPEEGPQPSASLAPNDTGRFIDRWVEIEIPENTICVWTRGIEPAGAAAMLPIAHGEGRFVVADQRVIDTLQINGQIAVRYAAHDNPNGSMAHVAGICDRSGLIFGLMPHPERFTSWHTHPFWTRLEPGERCGEPLGLRLFRNAVEHAREGERMVQ
jgi:phosphoribosylformylglycinamidine synthase